MNFKKKLFKKSNTQALPRQSGGGGIAIGKD